MPRPWTVLPHGPLEKLEPNLWAVEGTIRNYYSTNDKVLRSLYRIAEGGTKAIGCEGIPTSSRKVKNVDVSRVVRTHQEHLKAVRLR